MKINFWMILASSLFLGASSFAADMRRPAPAPAPGQPPPQQYYQGQPQDDGPYDDEDGPVAQGPVGPGPIVRGPVVGPPPEEAYGYGAEIGYFYDRSLPVYTPFIYYQCDFDYDPCDQEIVYGDGYSRFPYPIRPSARFNLHGWYSTWGPRIRQIPYRADGRFTIPQERGGDPRFYGADPRYQRRGNFQPNGVVMNPGIVNQGGGGFVRGNDFRAGGPPPGVMLPPQQGGVQFHGRMRGPPQQGHRPF